MALGAITLMMVRKDLIKSIIYGGILFLIVYFVFILMLNTLIFPDWIERNWNFEHLLGVTFLAIPLEEMLWALSFGMLWAPIYEVFTGYTLR